MSILSESLGVLDATAILQLDELITLAHQQNKEAI